MWLVRLLPGLEERLREKVPEELLDGLLGAPTAEAGKEMVLLLRDVAIDMLRAGVRPTVMDYATATEVERAALRLARAALAVEEADMAGRMVRGGRDAAAVLAGRSPEAATAFMDAEMDRALAELAHAQ